MNVVSLVSRSRRLLVAVRSSLYLLDWGVAGDAALRLVTTLDQGLPDNVINEGKADAHGRFWAGNLIGYGNKTGYGPSVRPMLLCVISRTKKDKVINEVA